MRNSNFSKKAIADSLDGIIMQSHKSESAFIFKGGLGHDLYSWRVFDQSLFHLAGFEDLSIYKNGKVEESEYVETYFNFGAYRKRIIPHKLNQFIQDGASIVLNKMQNKCIIINDLCQIFSASTGCLTNANSYAARGGDGTFNLHWDTHDVYAVQLIGKKRWKIYRPTFVNPLPNHKSKDCPERPTELYMDVVLEAGDILYIPRGWWHDAIPLEDQDTFHIAVGVFPNTVLDFLSWLVANKMPDFVSARDYIQGNAQEHLQKSLAYFSELALSEDVHREFCEAHTKHIRYKTELNTAAFFGNTVDIDTLKFNGVFKSQFNDAFIINGVSFSSGPEFQEICQHITAPQHCPADAVDKGLLKKLISFGIFS